MKLTATRIVAMWAQTSAGTSAHSGLPRAIAAMMATPSSPAAAASSRSKAVGLTLNPGAACATFVTAVAMLSPSCQGPPGEGVILRGTGDIGARLRKKTPNSPAKAGEGL